jgi:hypothetical protein
MDGSPVFWVLHVGLGIDPIRGRFTTLSAANLPDPQNVVVVNCCGDVQVPIESP